MLRRYRIFGDILRPEFSASRIQHVSDLRPKFALRLTMCECMVDIQSATAEIKPGKKEEDRRNHRAKMPKKYNNRICYAGRP